MQQIPCVCKGLVLFECVYLIVKSLIIRNIKKNNLRFISTLPKQNLDDVAIKNV